MSSQAVIWFVGLSIIATFFLGCWVGQTHPVDGIQWDAIAFGGALVLSGIIRVGYEAGKHDA